MFALPFVAALTVFELIFCAVLFLLLVFGAAFDRKGHEESKWWIFGIGLLALIVWFWSDWSFAGIWASLQSRAFWEPVLGYLGAGLVYSILEFVLDVRRSAREYKAAWESSNSKNASSFVSNYSRRNRVVELEVDDETGKPTPKINKSELAQAIGVWTFFWPAYFVSLIIGDLLTEIFNWLSELLVKISNSFVKWSFSDVFK